MYRFCAVVGLILGAWQGFINPQLGVVAGAFAGFILAPVGWFLIKVVLISCVIDFFLSLFD
ncbi:MAG: hypothetical protein SOU05_07035 [Atopobium sp.]|uniref:hypothetical protein n=1 Tax=Atopobium sp. TaxID=1872650 RepID=UPI002A75D869|nr:hypothetical protein [Atopobium sp.]MDY2789139.1 hypothetical protein [Atopobium sp.]